MSMSDPIADMLTRVRNAAKAKSGSVDIPGSNTKRELARVLKEEGFVRNYKVIEDNKQGILRVFLKYGSKNESAIVKISRVSRPSRRVYRKYKDIKPVLNGMGITILSTSYGVMTDKAAIRKKIGGELLCSVW